MDAYRADGQKPPEHGAEPFGSDGMSPGVVFALHACGVFEASAWTMNVQTYRLSSCGESPTIVALKLKLPHASTDAQKSLLRSHAPRTICPSLPPARIEAYGWQTILTSPPKPRYAGLTLP